MTIKFTKLRQVVMLPRDKTSTNGQPLPTEWLEGINRLLNETYKKECKKTQSYFDVYGQVFSQELLIIVSYLSEHDPFQAPISLFLSASSEHLKNEELVKETQNNFIDLTGLFFDDIFGHEEWNDFEPNWQEVTHKNRQFFYKITRENINATIEADRLLGEGGSQDDEKSFE